VGALPSAPSRSSVPEAPTSKASANAASAASGLSARSAKHTNSASRLLLLLATVLLQSGCYLGHLALGQARVLRAREPIEHLLADPATPAELRQELAVVEDVRAYAAQLGLETDGNYTSYVAWPGDRIVTSVVASEPGSVEPAGFWFPLLGRLPYKGYFDETRAQDEAARLRGDGLDVCLVAVPAYSTLGWFDDPVTGPMLRVGEGRLVETLLHELVHATAFVRGEVDFNEGVATFLGEEASVRFYELRGDREAARRRRREVEDARRYDAAVLAFRRGVEALYETQPTGPERAAERRRDEEQARRQIAALPLETADASELAAAARLNDACLALAATYTADLPDYERRLAELDGDLAAFVARLREAADSDDPRAALLGPLSDAP
jgi:predicted aminopeptidase